MSAELRVRLPSLCRLPGVWVLRLDGVATPEGVWRHVRDGEVLLELEWLLAVPGAGLHGYFRTNVDCAPHSRTELCLAL